MKNPAILLFTIVFISTQLIFNTAFSQIQITTLETISPVDMVENILGNGVQYSNVQYQGAAIASGIFTNAQTTSLGIGSGIFLTSGSGNLIPGPNADCGAGIDNGLAGDPLLDALTTSNTYDASVLEFDFVAESDTLRFKYVFGSEEYSENVFSTFNDVFGFFISGPDPEGGVYSDLNLALIPGTNSAVTINNVNNGNAPCGTLPTGPCTHCEFYSDNTNGFTLEYDGFIYVLTAWIQVVPCETYHVKIAIADAGNSLFDSGVFLEENSFESPMIEVEADPYPQGVSDNFIEGCVEADLIFMLPSPDYSPFTVYWDMSGSTADPAAFDPDGGDFYEAIPDHITFDEGTDSASIHVIAVMDGITEGPEVLQLVLEYALGCSLRHDTVEFIIEDYIEMVTQTTPNMIICEGQTVDLSVTAFNGFPPYDYEWEGFSVFNDTLTVTPDSSTLYRVNVWDECWNMVSDSIQVTVFPVIQFSSFSFEAALNPGLPFNVSGEFSNDTISLHLPAGTNLQNLVASYTFTGEDYVGITVNGVWQEPGVTPNDFTEPVIYSILSTCGAVTEYVVITDIETGEADNATNSIKVFPNPTSDHLMIRNASGWHLEMLNPLGVPLSQTLIPDSQTQLDVSDLDAGIYLLHFSRGEQEMMQRVVIAK